MQNTIDKAAAFHAKEKAPRFNFNKLQAVLCMAASAAVSIGLIIWAVKSFI
jgi:hypothetical protein